MRINKLCFLLTFLVGSAIGWSQNKENPDSVSKEKNLEELTVYGDNATISVGEITFIPTNKEKKAANGGYNLLRMMNMPQLNVDVAASSVKNISGQDVAIYVNGIEANPNEVDGILCTDVKKVVYLEMPTNPRYGTNKFVVDIITYKYEYGGYTKFAAKQSLPESNTKASGYSKMTYKDMVYDLNIGYGRNVSKHGGAMENETFDIDPKTIFREITPIDYVGKSNNLSAAFRATYERENGILTNNLSFSRSNMPESSLTERITSYTNDAMSSLRESQRRSNSKYTSAGWKGQGIFNLDKGWSINFSPSINLGWNKSNSYYILRDETISQHDELSIQTDASERNLQYGIDLGAIKSFARSNTLYLKASVDGLANKVRYGGSTNGTDKFNWIAEAINIGYSYQNQRFAIVPDIGLCAYTHSINSKKETIFYPILKLNAQLVLNERNYLILWLTQNTLAPATSEKSPLTIREDDMIWFKGNPKLDTYNVSQLALSYIWVPPHKVQLSGSFTATNYHDRMAYIFKPYESGIIREPLNTGDYFTSTLAVKGTLTLLDRSLKIGAQPSLSFSKSTGIYHRHIWDPYINLSINYYAGGFYFSGNYRTQSRYFAYVTAEKVKTPERYDISAGWANANWNLSLTAANFLRYKWTAHRNYFHSEYYDRMLTEINADYHAKYELAVTYTFGYGKKVKQGNEVQPLQDNESAINKY